MMDEMMKNKEKLAQKAVLIPNQIELYGEQISYPEPPIQLLGM